MDSNIPPTLEEVCGQAVKLPTAPSLMPRLISVLNDPDSSAEDIQEIIQVDPALTATTLRLANSAFFGGGQPVESVVEAVMKLGQKEIYRLASMALVNRWDTAATGKNAYGGDPGDFCRHAVCMALAAEVLAERMKTIEPQMAYTAGLVCDMGKLVVAHSCSTFFPAIRERQKASGASWMQAERDILGYDQYMVGSSLLQTWKFPSALVVAAEFINRPAEAPEDAKQLLALLHAAKILATSIGPGVTEDGFLFEINEELLAEQGFTSEILEGSLPEILERCTTRLRDKLTHGQVSA
ncbi:MAG TPA: HDOD domain-containing protein [Opitutaceae bacterium]|jgi:HD-like signal output (HDOD) protein|nr:HDOD domain-containing protein [Opitutaceae bacterium]